MGNYWSLLEGHIIGETMGGNVLIKRERKPKSNILNINLKNNLISYLYCCQKEKHILNVILPFGLRWHMSTQYNLVINM